MNMTLFVLLNANHCRFWVEINLPLSLDKLPEATGSFYYFVATQRHRSSSGEPFSVETGPGDIRVNVKSYFLAQFIQATVYPGNLFLIKFCKFKMLDNDRILLSNTYFSHLTVIQYLNFVENVIQCRTILELFINCASFSQK